MMRLRRGLWIGLLCLPLLARAASNDEPLAGEVEEATPVPAKAGAALPEESAPMSSARTQRPIAAFQLPEFVISGSGEKKALTGRGSLNNALDTSGGIKASPGEEGASKGQMQALTQREDLNALSSTARPSFGQAHLTYGLRNTLDVDAFYGRQAGPWATLLRGDLGLSDGGLNPELLPALAQSGHEGVGLRVSRELEGGAQAWIDGDARWRRRFWTRSTLPAPRTERFLGGAQAAWEDSGLWHTRLGLEGQHGWIALPGLGLVYAEDFARAQLQFSRALSGRTGSALIEGGLDFASQAASITIAKQLFPWRAWFDSGFRPWSGGHLRVGIEANGVGGDAIDLLVSPRFRLDQRLGARSGLHAMFQGGLDLPSMRGDAFGQDLVFPDPRLRLSRRVADAEIGVTHAFTSAWRLELAGFVRQNEDAFLADDPGRLGLWTQTWVKTLRVMGLRLGQAWVGKHGWSQELQGTLRQADLLDFAGLTPTFIPAWQLDGRLGRAWGAWTAGVKVAARAETNARLLGALSAPAYVDLGADLRYDIHRTLSLLAEGRDLLGQARQDWPGTSEASPYVGAGILLRF